MTREHQAIMKPKKQLSKQAAILVHFVARQPGCKAVCEVTKLVVAVQVKDIGSLLRRGSNVRYINLLCEVSAGAKSGLLTGCDKKTEITRYFRGKLCDKNGLLCDKLCDFFLSYFELILLGFRGGKPLWGCSKDKLNIKGQKLSIYG